MRKEQLLNIYEDNGLYGAKDQNGQIVITAQYTEMIIAGSAPVGSKIAVTAAPAITKGVRPASMDSHSSSGTENAS